MIKTHAKNPQSYDIYDFDKTIYKGDSSIHFYFFCLSKKPGLLVYLPYQLWHLILFLMKLEDRNTFKKHFFVFLRGLDDTATVVEWFWQSHYQKIKPWYQDKDHSKDVIISASPEFLLQPLVGKLKPYRLIATHMDPANGLINGKNCRGQEKVVRLRQVLGKPMVKKAYSDSLADLPILSMAEEGFIVKGDKILSLQSYQQMPRFKRLFL